MKHKRLALMLVGALLLTVIVWKFPYSEDPRSSAQKHEQTKHTEYQIRDLSTPESYLSAWRASSQTTGERDRILEQAQLRRDKFLELMREQPAEALEQAIGISDYVALPNELKPYFESPFSVRGDIDLLWETSIEGCNHGEGCDHSEGAEHTHRTCVHRNRVIVGDEQFEAFTEKKGHLPVLKDVPVAGIRLGHQVVLSESAVRPVAEDDFEAAASLFPGGWRHEANSTESAALIAGKLHTLGHETGLDVIEEMLADANNDAVNSRTSIVQNPLEWLSADEGGDDGEGVDATPYQVDQIKVLFIRVDFSDFPGAPISAADLESALNTVDGHLNNFSYGQAGLANVTIGTGSGSIVTSQVYRMPSTGANYATDSASGDGEDGNDRIQDDARALASADYTISDYDVVAVYFPSLSGVSGSLITYGGLASIGGSRHWINGVSSFGRVGVILHEFGHNYGLYHANYYIPEQNLGGTYQVPGSLEYGDIFDEMGSGNSPEAHFSHLAKNYMDWMPDSKVAEATSDGTYTIYRFDDIGATSNPLLALKVPMSGDVNYWVGYRQLYTSSSYNLSNAAYVVAENLASARETSLIDMTPESTSSESADRRDAGLPVGGTYYDSDVGVRFNALEKGGTAPNQWIKVQVLFEPRVFVDETNLNVDEQAGVASVVVHRAYNSTGVVTVNYATSDGTASSGSDYYPVSGTLTWEDGDMADKTIIIPVRPDVVTDGGEDFTLTLSGIVGGKIDPAAATATITLLEPGQRITSFAPGFFNSTVYAIKPLSDGKVLVGGNIYEGITSGNMVRLNPDGSVDETFATGTGFNDHVRAIDVQSDGMIIVGGDFTSYNGTACNRVVRLGPNGAIDNSFVTAMGSGADGDVWTVAVEASGQILVGGLFDNFNGTTANGLVRLSSTGLPATALALPFDSGASVWQLLAEPDGKMMVAGNFTSGGNERDIMRLTSTGARDSSFNGGSASNGGVYSVARMPDGKYVLGGYFNSYNGNSATRFCRVNANGSFDGTFANVGFNSSVRRVAAQADGKALAGGFFSSPATRLERLTTTGAVDSDFDQGAGPGGGVYEIAVDDDGAIWVGGNFYSYNSVPSRPIVKIAGGFSPYDVWVQTQFTAAEIVAGDSDPEDDPDGDGIINLAEMAMGTNPTVANTDQAFAVSANGGITFHNTGGQDYLQLTLDKSTLAKGAWFVAQFSNDMVTWSPASPSPGVNTTYEVIENTDTKFIVRDKTPISTATPRFGRIMIKTPE